MRGALRVCAYIFAGLLSLSSIIRLIDWLGRWDWLIGFMLAHPVIALIFRSPLPYVMLMAIGLLSLGAERLVKAPNIKARYINFRAIPDLHSATVRMAFESQEKRPGWDLHRFDWDWFVEVQMVNDSEMRATLDRLKVEITLGRRWNRKVFEFKCLDDLDSFDMDMALDGEGKRHGQRVFGERYLPIPSLMSKIKGIPLEQEIGHQGWIHFKVFQVSQREMNDHKIQINIWIVDANQREHKLHFRKRDQKTWDNNFFIGPKCV